MRRLDPEVFQETKDKADAGDVDAQLAVGEMYERGIGTIQDGREAIRWYVRAHENGNRWAAYQLAYIYENGKVVPQDFAESNRWYSVAAQHLKEEALAGDLDAQCTLGLWYEVGLGFREDGDEAFEWYTAAATQGHAQAQFQIGLMYYHDARGISDVDDKKAEARKWFGLAAAQGYEDAQQYLELMDAPASPKPVMSEQERRELVERLLRLEAGQQLPEQ